MSKSCLIGSEILKLNHITGFCQGTLRKPMGKESTICGDLQFPFRFLFPSESSDLSEPTWWWYVKNFSALLIGPVPCFVIAQLLSKKESLFMIICCCYLVACQNPCCSTVCRLALEEVAWAWPLSCLNRRELSPSSPSLSIFLSFCCLVTSVYGPGLLLKEIVNVL